MSNNATVVKFDTYANTVDELGKLRAQIKRLQDEAKLHETLLKSAAKAEGRSEFHGLLYRVTVSCTDRVKVDWKKIAEKLLPSRQLVSAHTSHSEVYTVRVSAHKKGG